MAVVNLTCRCGRTVSAPCPTLADLQKASASIHGWGFDERGFVRCPDCAAAPAERVAVEQGELF